MVSLEKFIIKTLGVKPKEIGEIIDEVFDPVLLISTRPFLIKEKMSGKRKRRGSIKPEVVIYDQFWRFIIDGHHKVRSAYDARMLEIECRTFHTTDPRIKEALFRRATDLPDFR